MIDFSEKTRIAPRNEVMISFLKFQDYIIGRFDYIEDISRRMEREQLKPTHDMLKCLFDGTALREEWNMEEGKVSFDKYHDVLEARGKDQRSFSKVLDKITKIEPTFGKPYFKEKSMRPNWRVFERN